MTKLQMRQVESVGEILSRDFSFPGKTVVDVGCGTGDLVRWAARQGATITGIDSVEMLAKADGYPLSEGEKYLVGCAESLPFPDEYADLITYIASFHHVAEGRAADALEECTRVLKSPGRAVFIEPLARPDSYYRIVRLIEEEAEARNKACETLLAASRPGFELKFEEICFMERSFADYMNLLEIFVEDDERRVETLSRAIAITDRLSRRAGLAFEDYRYQSICRVLIFEKR